MKDLVIVVPDNNVKVGIEALLERYIALGIRKIQFDIYRHPDSDPGVFKNSFDILRGSLGEYSFAVVLIDYCGCGQESEKSISEVENKIKQDLSRNGWSLNSEVIVLNPEFDIWFWIDSPHTAKAIGWETYAELRAHLQSKNLWIENNLKPEKPKEALEDATREKRIPRSSSIYREVALRASFRLCQDPSFLKLKEFLQSNFHN